MNNLPPEIKLSIISNLDEYSKVCFISSSKLLNNYFFEIFENKILKIYMKNNCDNISKNQQNSINKNNKNNYIKIENKISFINKLNDIIKKRYTDG